MQERNLWIPYPNTTISKVGIKKSSDSYVTVTLAKHVRRVESVAFRKVRYSSQKQFYNFIRENMKDFLGHSHTAWALLTGVGRACGSKLPEERTNQWRAGSGDPVKPPGRATLYFTTFSIYDDVRSIHTAHNYSELISRLNMLRPCAMTVSWDWLKPPFTVQEWAKNWV